MCSEMPNIKLSDCIEILQRYRLTTATGYGHLIKWTAIIVKCKTIIYTFYEIK